MSMDTDLIFKPIANHIERYDALLKEMLETDSEFIFKITKHLFSRTGKRLRPALLFLSVGRTDNPAAVYAAVAIELIHAATLLHDDVIDESDARRGIETVNHRWDNLVSVLMGDYLFSKSFKLLVKSGFQKLLEGFAAATERVSIGELNQVYLTGNFDIDEDQYLRVLADKTASLFACACESGVICNGGDEERMKNMREFGENLGIAFQITDDILDLVGEPTKTGKKLGSDIREGWVTLPMIHSLRNSDGSYKDKIIKLYNSEFTNDGFEKVIKFISDNDGIDYADQKARMFSERAKEALAKADGLDYKENLLKLADFAVVRDK
ncbi:MAG: polyprenyl synthetase family protein [candidate division Zixibacteria bacterium]|nr:polyprenyl synthetase family protein [candidate division Zixibacteria bacterium]